MLHSNDKDIKIYYSKMFNLILGLFLSLSVGMISCLPFVFPIMINSKFSDSYQLIPILVLANIFNIIVSMTGVLYSAHKNTKAIASTSILSAIINLVVHLVFIKFIGLYAAVVSTLVSYFVMALYRLHTAHKQYFKVKIKKSIISKTVIVLPIVLLLYYKNIFALNFISIIISLIYAYSMNKKSFSIILKMVKKKKI